MTELVFLVEGKSEKVMLQGLLPRMLPENVSYSCIAFKGKGDLERNLVGKIRSYRKPQTRFIVLRDKDSDDCIEVKRRLLEKCQEAKRPDSLVRIACHELESWYLADLAAVEKGLGLPTGELNTSKNSIKYQNPDTLDSPKEKLKQLTDKFYQEVSGSLEIGKHLDPANTRSRSFAVFVSGVRKAAGAGAEPLFS
jgi:hypothetical protein